MKAIGFASLLALALLLVGCSAETPAAGSRVEVVAKRLDEPAVPTGAQQASQPIGQEAPGIVVNHRNFRFCERASSAVVGQVAKLRVFFAHASVGGNIVSGMRSLHDGNAKRFPLQIAGTGDHPSETVPGTLYEYDRGNPGAAQKISLFEQYAGNGWTQPKVDVILNKFCYIDGDADFTRYIESMKRIESRATGVVVVYATMPIMTQDNAQRQAFNERVRDWTGRNRRVLLDIADIEAFDPSGAACTEGGRQALCQAYSADGGHLNDAGSVAVAKGFYTLLGALATRRS